VGADLLKCLNGTIAQARNTLDRINFSAHHLISKAYHLKGMSKW